MEEGNEGVAEQIENDEDWVHELMEQFEHNEKIGDWVQKATQSAEVVDNKLEELENKYDIATDSVFRQILLEKVVPPVPPETILGGTGIGEQAENGGETAEAGDTSEDEPYIPPNMQDEVDEHGLQGALKEEVKDNEPEFRQWVVEESRYDGGFQDIAGFIEGLDREEQAEALNYLHFRQEGFT